VTQMVAIVQRYSRPAFPVSPGLAELIIVILLAAAAVLVLGSLDALAPDVTLPQWLLVPGAPDLERAFV
jgi:hypothetical protein